MAKTSITNTRAKLELDKLPEEIKILVDENPELVPSSLGISGDNIAEIEEGVS